MIGIERTENLLELAKLYSHAQVLLNLSYQETFGMTTIEAAACGTPAIVYNATASPELVTHQTGIIVNPGDINGVYSAINEILNKGKSHYSEYCRLHAVSKFNNETGFFNYVSLYNQLLSPPRQA